MTRDASQHSSDDDVPPDPLDTTSDMWLVPVTGWDWDQQSLIMGEYVGYPLYLRLRERLQSLRVPVLAHDVLIQQMIDTHDASAVAHGEARSTCVIWSDLQLHMPVEVLDSTEWPTLTGIA